VIVGYYSVPMCRVLDIKGPTSQMSVYAPDYHLCRITLYYIIYTNHIEMTPDLEYLLFFRSRFYFSKSDFFFFLVLILISVFQSIDKKVIHGLVLVNKVTMILQNYLSNLTCHIFHIFIARDQLVSLYNFIFLASIRVFSVGVSIHMHMKLKVKNNIFK